MFKRMLLAAGIAASMLFAGCAATPVQSPAQIAAAFCPAANNAVTLLTAFNVTVGSTVPDAVIANKVIEKTVKPIVRGACAAGATITSTNVQALIDQGIPAIAGVVAALPLDPVTQAAIQAGFAAAELTANLVGQYENALAAAKASNSPTASAPVAVSTPLAGAPLQ